MEPFACACECLFFSRVPLVTFRLHSHGYSTSRLITCVSHLQCRGPEGGVDPSEAGSGVPEERESRIPEDPTGTAEQHCQLQRLHGKSSTGHEGLRNEGNVCK